MLIGRKEVLGRQIREARQKARYTIRGLAEKVNLPQNSISKMELYGQGISLPRLERIAGALDIPLEQLLQTAEGSDVNSVSASPPKTDLLHIPVFDKALRQPPSSLKDKASRSLSLPALSPLDDVSKLYVWDVAASHLPQGLRYGDHVVIEWREMTRAQDVVGRMVVGYQHDDQVVIGRVGPNESDYHLHDDYPQGWSLPCSEIEIYGIVRWGWREF